MYKLIGLLGRSLAPRRWGIFASAESASAPTSNFDRASPDAAGKSGYAHVSPALKSLTLDGKKNGASELRYLPFVDGLRAVSILAVVAFHIGVPGISGGFIGVDIFFVISGFLIVNQITAGLSSGRLTIFSFYARRVLRIIPVYLIVLLATYAFAPLFVSTTAEYWDFLSSAILAPLMVSNVGFYLTQGYFDISAIEKPLLHTWTLSVEEQFYLVAPILLALIFRLNRRFGLVALFVGLVLLVASLAGAITHTSALGRNAAFYLPQWRAWQFLAGALIGAPLASVIGRLPRAVAEIIGWLGAGCVAVAIATFDATTLYPSANAILPTAGAALIILSGIARPETTLVRVLSLSWLVVIGLVSYGWYLWHWPILSFIRMAQVGDSSFVIDFLGGGALAFALAVVTYRFVELPIRRWRRTPGRLKHPQQIVLKAIAACLATALIGGTTAFCGYWLTKSYLASRYGVEGNGILENGCDSQTGFKDSCFDGRVGVILGDSHATVLSGSFAKRFDESGVRLVSLARGSCGPLLLAPSERQANRHDDCTRLIGPIERLVARPKPVTFAIITGFWGYTEQMPTLLSELISNFSPHTHILLIGPVPTFAKSSLECVVLSDRYIGNRDRCIRPRSEVQASTSAAIQVLRTMPDRFANVRYIDLLNIFCDQKTCRPFKDNVVLYTDTHHLSQAGADLVYNSFQNEFLWLAERK